MIKIRNTVLAKNIIYCRSLFSRIKGLMLKRNLDVNTSYILVNKKDSIEESSIHTFFMLFKIDILWVNSENIIVDKREDVKPFKLILRPIKPAKYVIELNSGKTKSINIGDKIKFL